MEIAPDGTAGPQVALLVLHGPEHVEQAAELCGALRAAGGLAERHALSALALESDRKAIAELDFALDAMAARTATPRERCAVLGLARGGTLAFLLGCARRVAAVVDVDGPVLYATLSPERPIQPLELALNLEGAFLGLFSRSGPVGAEERARLEERLRAAARPYEIAEVRGADGTGYDAPPAPELARRVLDFLSTVTSDDDLPHA